MKALNNLIARIAILALVATSVWEIDASLANADEIDIPSFRKAALQKWEEMFNAADGYSSITLLSAEENEGLRDNENCVTETKILFPFHLQEEVEGIHHTLTCGNSAYYFSLHKDGDEADWQINYIKRNPTNWTKKKNWLFRRPFSFTKDGALKVAYTDDDIERGLRALETHSQIWAQVHPSLPLSRLFDDPEFKITNLAEVENESGEALYRFDFTYDRDFNDVTLIGIKSGTIELNRSDYSIRHIVYETSGTSYGETKCELDLEYGDKDRVKFPNVSKKTLHVYDKDGTLRHHETVHYTWRSADELTEDRFKLSFYGFKEPNFADEIREESETRYSLVGLGILLIACATIILVFRRKRESAP